MKSLLIAALVAAAAPVIHAESYDARLLSALRWRMIGPYRGGRTRSVAGVADQPNVFYIGACNGGIWKTDDYGRTWQPIFDDQDTGSIGAIAVAPSDPNIIYAASGEGLHRPDLSTGDGVYKSTDAGKTWTHLGLRDGQQIPQLAIDPHNPDRVFAAVLGHPYGPNPERGIFRSNDGGRTFEKVLYKDENTGGSEVVIDPRNPEIVYATLWEAREGPWENGAWSGTGGGIFKSTDGGTTWNALTRGLPAGADSVIQANLAIAPSQPSRIYASIAHGTTLSIYRSDDGGENWSSATTDPRPATRVGGGGELPFLTVDPQNADVVYSASIVAWKSVDGGKTWTALRGAPGGDDYQKVWVNPHHPEILGMVSDQGAIVTVNGGQTWSSWYVLPTAQMYHVAADNAFPYRLCGGQQESGSACIASRGNDGQITDREWHPVGLEEYGYAAPDPLDPDTVYGGKLTRYDRRTGQTEDISPKPLRDGGFRAVRTEPVLFSPLDPHTLYFAANALWKTRDRGHHWQQISPDLTRTTWEIPASVGKYREADSAKATRRGVIYAVAPSPIEINRIWAGTDDGLIHLTTDGGLHWRDVTPPQLVPWAKVSILDAGHFDAATCYAAINTLRLDDMRPHIYRTHDSGKTWTEIVDGLPDGAPVNVVREDPRRKGLLFAGTERAAYVSFDDGAHWQSLRLNMPATSIRDLIVKGDDLAVATHGRGFWVLDDMTPLRQLTPAVPSSAAMLFRPAEAIRVRWDMNTDTPMPPDEPAAENPPDGAIVDYWLGEGVAGVVSLEIRDSAGRVVRRFASDDRPEARDPQLPIPPYWLRPTEILSAASGMHRWIWDLHYPPIPSLQGEYPIAAVYRKTVPDVTSPWVMPGRYTVVLTANGQSYSQPLAVKMDPRVHTPVAALAEQAALSRQIYEDMLAAAKAQAELHAARARLTGDLAEEASALDGEPNVRRRGAAAADSLSSVPGQLTTLLRAVQSADAAPTAQEGATASDRHQALRGLLNRWAALQAKIGK